MPTLIITVNLECCRCSSKIQKILCCIQQGTYSYHLSFSSGQYIRKGEFVIKKIMYEKNKVLVSGPFDADKLSSKLWCKAGRIVKNIEVAKPPPKPDPKPEPKPKPEPSPCKQIYPYPYPFPCPQPGVAVQLLKASLYMVVEVFIDAARGEQDPVILTQFNITKVIRDSIQLNFGECGLAGSLGSLQVKYVNPVTKLCIVRVSREDHQKVWAAMTMVRCIGKIPVSFNLLDMSGSIRACKKAALECDEAKFEQYKVAAGNRITTEIIQSVESCFEKIRGLES
ncbi:unnamed protein product [Miscanthus lutarioriparius]|uniref:Uncharacterized protein n=1 Tax=Miscanthus lutarioriparius TaxID=422564 RepID=A0A811QXM9_9POAL|nr:unnamed protein product [Miscanthus lutarioriparius]